jgi:predicted nucleic acid-binding Zn ribbon protein
MCDSPARMPRSTCHASCSSIPPSDNTCNKEHDHILFRMKVKKKQTHIMRGVALNTQLLRLQALMAGYYGCYEAPCILLRAMQTACSHVCRMHLYTKVLHR